MFDLDDAKAQQLADKTDSRSFASLDEAVSADDVDVVVNLTSHAAHGAVITAALQAGRHVYTEKPLSMDLDEARMLAELARGKGLRLGSAPGLFLGPAQQAAIRHVRSGALGRVRVAYAEMNWGRLETWHPAPAPFYKVGPMADLGIYPLTLLSATFGPVASVSATGDVVLPERRDKSGTPFVVGFPDWTSATLTFVDGTIARVTASLYVGGTNTRQQGIEFHGDDASLHLHSSIFADCAAETSPFNEDAWQPLGVPGSARAQLDWCLGLADFHDAIRNNRPHRTSAELALHVVEVILAAHRSMQEHQPVGVQSRFETPRPVEYAS